MLEAGYLGAKSTGNEAIGFEPQVATAIRAVLHAI